MKQGQQALLGELATLVRDPEKPCEACRPGSWYESTSDKPCPICGRPTGKGYPELHELLWEECSGCLSSRHPKYPNVLTLEHQEDCPGWQQRGFWGWQDWWINMLVAAAAHEDGLHPLDMTPKAVLSAIKEKVLV